MDDWQYSVSRPDTNGHQSYFAGRGLLDVKVNDAVRFNVNFNGWDDTSQPQAQQLIAIKPEGPAKNAPELGATFSPNDARAADWVDQILDPATGTILPGGATAPGTAKLGNFDPYSDRKFYQAVIRGDVDLTPAITLTSLTSFDHFTQQQSTSGDGMDFVSFDLPVNDGYIHSFNQELRLANTGSAALHWIAGANYEDSTTFENQVLRYFDNSNYAPSNLYIDGSGITNLQKITNYAAFGNIDYSLTSQFTLHAGARYTDSNNKADICSYTPHGANVNNLFNLLGSLLGKVPFTPITESGCYTLNENDVPGQPFIRSLNQDNVSWRTGIDYQFDPDTLFYISASRGFKAGSFPSLAAALYVGLQPVIQESVTDFEGGVKARFLDRRLDIDGAIFYYRYADKQVRGKLLDPIFGILDAEVNVPKSDIKGAELEATYRPVEGLSINPAITYLDSQVVQYTGVDIIGLTTNFAGTTLPFTPKWSGVFNVDYRYKMDAGVPFAGMSVRAQSLSYAALGGDDINYSTPTPAAPTTYLRPGVGCVFCIDSYATVDARLGYEARDGHWKIMAYGKNILNKYYWTNVIPSNDSAARFAGMPATFGVTFSEKFK
jgi:outer membrane receptor protein involved in Fe transport